MWGHSSDGRATRLQRVGRRFDPDWLHQSVEDTFFTKNLYISLISSKFTPICKQKQVFLALA